MVCHRLGTMRPVGRRQLQRWEYVCDGHYFNGQDCPVSVIVDAVDMLEAAVCVGLQGWTHQEGPQRHGAGCWLCGSHLHREQRDVGPIPS